MPRKRGVGGRAGWGRGSDARRDGILFFLYPALIAFRFGAGELVINRIILRELGVTATMVGRTVLFYA